MSGHSKWSTIKRKKGAIDAKRGKIFTKLIRELTVAARQGGADPNTNPRLRLAIDKAKGQNMPNDNITRAIKKGTGELGDGSHYDEYQLEGYGPGGVAMLLDIMTDNKNRTTPEVRRIFQKHGGNFGASGSVAWQFQRKGFLMIDRKLTSEEQLIEIALEAGADDIREGKEDFEILTPPDHFAAVKHALEEKKIAIHTAEISMIPQNTVKITGKNAGSMLQLMEEMEDCDDVQNVYANFDIDDAEMAHL